MEAVKIEGHTRILGKPENWDASQHGECVGLPIKDVLIKNHPVMVSEFTLSPEERKQIAEGGNIRLYVWGEGHPPVALDVKPIQIKGPLVID